MKRNYTRRDFLKTAGVAAGLGAASKLGIQQLIQRNHSNRPSYNRNPTGAATGEDYEIIEVGPGEVYRYQLSDGETFENKLFDVNGGCVQIDARASDWTIRNIGVRGEVDGDLKDSGMFPFGVSVPNGSTGVMENVYVGDGDTASSHGGSGSTACMFVYPSHGGTFELQNVYIEGWHDNGLYGSDPGHTAVSSNGGEIHVHDSYSANNTASNWRFGTDGSYMKNTVSWGAIHRGVWAYFENVELIDCDCGGSENPDRAVEAGGSAYDKMAYASVTLTNTRTEGTTTRNGTNEIHGSSAGTPQHRIPEGTPTTAVEAASGAASGGSTGTGGGGEICTEDDYEVIEVGAGETFTKNLSDGETWENKIIDISASGAGYSIAAEADNWTIRNIGVRGEWDHSPPSSPINLEVSSSGATGLVENFYLGDGVAHSPSANEKPTGMYVNASHAGDLTIRNVNIQEMPDNAIYASSPGNGSAHHRPGSGGTVTVENGYFENNMVSDVRLGTDGSVARNCIGFNNQHRGYWGYYGSTEVINCDFGNSGRSDIHVGDDNWEASRNAEVTVTNTRFDTTEVQGADLNGSSAGTPQKRSPSDVGAPSSAKEAACGGISTEEPETANTLEITNNTTQPVHYLIGADGLIQPENTGQKNAVFTNKATATITSRTDAYKINGQITQFQATGNPEITYNGQSMTVEEMQQVCQNNRT